MQNRFNVAERGADDVLARCEADGIGFMSWAPIGMGDLTAPGTRVAEIAARRNVTPAQVALAWLLQHSPAILPIPGTGSIDHMGENIAAARIELSEEDLLALSAVAA